MLGGGSKVGKGCKGSYKDLASKRATVSQAWRHVPLIPVFGKGRQEDWSPRPALAT